MRERRRRLRILDPDRCWHARCLFALGRFDESMAIFKRLSDKHPQEPRPRSGLLEAKLELALAQKPDDVTKPADELEQAAAAAPAGFAETVEGLYLRGRAAELKRELDDALGFFERARAIDPQHYALLTRYAHLAERTGLDDLGMELYEDLLHLRHGTERLVNSDIRAELAELAAAASFQWVEKAAAEVEEMDRYRRRNIQPQIALDAVALRLRQSAAS